MSRAHDNNVQDVYMGANHQLRSHSHLPERCFPLGASCNDSFIPTGLPALTFRSREKGALGIH